MKEISLLFFLKISYFSLQSDLRIYATDTIKEIVRIVNSTPLIIASVFFSRKGSTWTEHDTITFSLGEDDLINRISVQGTVLVISSDPSFENVSDPQRYPLN